MQKYKKDAVVEHIFAVVEHILYKNEKKENIFLLYKFKMLHIFGYRDTKFIKHPINESNLKVTHLGSCSQSLNKSLKSGSQR